MNYEERANKVMQGRVFASVEDMEEARGLYMEFLTYKENVAESFEQMKSRVSQGLGAINKRLDEAVKNTAQ